jgi:hypothetical protein
MEETRLGKGELILGGLIFIIIILVIDFIAGYEIGAATRVKCEVVSVEKPLCTFEHKFTYPPTLEVNQYLLNESIEYISINTHEELNLNDSNTTNNIYLKITRRK